jgi:glycosyltransferase involved in cell wall biosynthesis
MPDNGVLFISTMGVADAACEELWSQTAIDLSRQGIPVSASVNGWRPDHWRMQNLEAAGVHVQSRPSHYPLWKRGWHYIFFRGKPKSLLQIEKLLRKGLPKLVVFNEGFPYPPIELIELCISRNLPFVTIAHGNYEEMWPIDATAARYRQAFAVALRCFFVSKAVLRLVEKHIGCELNNAEMVWSQCNVDLDASQTWPISSLEGELRLASVARLDPSTKGQDILLEALARPVWTNRSWHLSFYGDGPRRDTLERFAARLGLSDRVTFAGHVGVEEIWSSNQVLLMPSRHEGLPHAVLEAMLCGRPVLATDVGDHSEIIVDGVTGFLAGPPTVASVAEGLERLWANRANLENMGRAGAKRIRELVPADPISVFSEKIKHLL